MNRQRIYLLLLLSLSLLQGCKKEEDELPDAVPELEFVSVSPQVATEFSDSLVFTIRYRDGDGDLGENSPDVNNLFLTDNRIGIQYVYRVQQLAPSGTAVPITGTLQVVLNTVARTDSSLAQQVATFSLFMRDRAGNNSNTVTSPPVTIRP